MSIPLNHARPGASAGRVGSLELQGAWIGLKSGALAAILVAAALSGAA